MRWTFGVLAAVVVTLAFVPISEAKKCKKTEKNCGGECIDKDAPCKKVRTLGGKTDKEDVEATPDKEDATGKTVEDKLKGGDKGKADKGKADKGKAEPAGPKAASTANIKGCRSHTDLNALDKDVTLKLIQDAGWTASDPKVKSTDGYDIWVYEVKKGGESAVIGVYSYAQSAHAIRLEGSLNTHKNVAAALSGDQTHVIAAILPKSGNKADAKELLNAVVACQK